MSTTHATPTLYVLDGYSLIYRSYFAFINRPLMNPKGENVSAFVGFFRTLLSFFGKYDPDEFVVVMDSRTPTFRHEMYPEYKATREKAPEDLHSQVPLIERTLEAMNIGVLRRDGVEADDIIATLADSRRKAGRECRIISGDKDLLQLVGEHVKMLRPDGGDYRELGAREVRDELGISPEQVVDYLSLTGDQADNVPGVRGIGPKTAAKLLGSFKSLEGIYAHLDKCSKGEQKKLREGKENAFLSRKLIILRPLEGTGEWEQLLSSSGIDLSAAVPIFIDQNAQNLAEQAKGSSLSGEQRRAAAAGGQEKSSGYAGKGAYEAVTDAGRLQEVLEQVRKAGRFAFDVETDNIDDMYASPVGFCIAVETGAGWYIPLQAAGTRYFSDEQMREALRPVLQDPKLELIGHNFKYDYKVLSRWGLAPSRIAFDTMVAAWLLDTTASGYGLDALAEKWLGYRTIHYDEVVPGGSGFADVALEQARDYAAEDADVTLRLCEVCKPRLAEEGQEQLFYEMEAPLVQILAEMELRGIRLLPERLREYGRELEKELEELQQQVWKECGREFNLNSPKQLQEVLFKERKLKPVKKTKTGYSTDVSVLEELAKEDVVPDLVLQHRSRQKLKSTYVDTLPELVNPQTGRVHTRLLQTGTATGRLSSRDPNLQNIPIREESGRRIRRAFVPREGCKLISADYSQIELVVLAHLSGDPALTQAFKAGEDVHRHTGSLIFGAEPDEVSAEQRRIAKTINFGVMYGMSAFRLSRELEIPRNRAEEFITAYFNKYAHIQHFIQQTVQEAEEKGYVSTMYGRRRPLPGINSRNNTEKQGAERIAVNTPIQGTAADIVKTAMLRIDRLIRKEDLPLLMLLQIHDELMFEAPAERAEELAERLKTEMEQAVQLDAPLKVSVEVGDSWGDFH
jgi:DNA polymerase-1